MPNLHGGVAVPQSHVSVYVAVYSNGSLIDLVQGYDSIGLNLELKNAMESQNRLSLKDSRLPWFVDADILSGAITPTGSYEISGDTAVVNLILLRRGRTTEKIASAKVSGSRKDVKALASRVLEAANRLLQDGKLGGS